MRMMDMASILRYPLISRNLKRRRKEREDKMPSPLLMTPRQDSSLAPLEEKIAWTKMGMA
jgi:hypothetical protein